MGLGDCRLGSRSEGIPRGGIPNWVVEQARPKRCSVVRCAKEKGIEYLNPHNRFKVVVRYQTYEVGAIAPKGSMPKLLRVAIPESSR